MNDSRLIRCGLGIFPLGFFIFGMVMANSAVLAEEGAPFVYDDRGQRDPLWPLVSLAGAVQTFESELLVSDLTLEGILYTGPGTSAAIVNGRVVRVNDQVGPYTVQEIGSESMILVDGEERFELRLKKGE